VIRKEAWTFYRTISGVRLCWELEEPKGPKGHMIKKTHESGRSVFLKMRPVQVNVLYWVNTPAKRR